jgi:hypothetical protein
MSQKTYTRSFAGGEIAPALFGRLDLAKFQTGLQKCLNFIVTPQGPIENRPGFEYVIRAKDTAAPPVLIPFVYNSEQSFALEFGAGYIRFHTQGATLLESSQNITGITQAATGVLTYSGSDPTNGQWFFLSGIGGMTELNSRYVIVANVNAGSNTFELTDLFGDPIDTSGMAAYTAGGTMSRVYEISSPYAADDLQDLHFVQSADVLTIVHQDYAPRELRRLGATNWTLTEISFEPTIAAPSSVTATASGPGGGVPEIHRYAATSLKDGTLEESFRSALVSETLDLNVNGNFIDIDIGAVTGSVRFNVYKRKGGVFGYIGQSSGAALRDNNIQPDMSKTPPLPFDPFDSESPRAVSYYEQRRCFAGGGTNPQNLWLTRSGTESNMTYSIPTQDDDAITARIVAREAQTVRHLVPLGDLLALTSGGVWKVTSSDGGAITPATISVKPQSYVGASNVQPVVTSNSVLYAQDRGSHVREVAYSWETQTYVASDASVLAPHLFDFKAVRQMTLSASPYQVLWAVRSDGKLLGMTYQPEHEVKAWHQHQTAGEFKSVCSVPEGDEDGVYVVAKRTVQGAGWYYIERLHTRQFAALEDAFFVDSGLTYSGAAATVISGLHHLEGEEVIALAGGGVVTGLTVENGRITLAAAATPVHVGLPYDCDAQTMPLSLEVPALGQAANKNVNAARLRVYLTAGVQMGPSFAQLREMPPRTVADGADTPPGMRTGVLEMKLSPSWQDDGAMCVRQANPLPMTILSLTLETATGG